MASFVLLHDRFLGGWCWKRVVPRLRTLGHEVLAPTLTGCGERCHLHGDGTPLGIGTHVTDVLHALRFHDLKDVYLLGHGYSGLLLPAVADQSSGRISHMVFLNAWIPAGNQSWLELCGKDTALQVRESVKSSPDQAHVPPEPIESFALPSAEDAAWVRERLTHQPLATLEQAPPETSDRVNGVARTFLSCTEAGEALSRLDRRARDMGWPVIELVSGHYPMLTIPRRLATVLHELVQ